MSSCGFNASQRIATTAEKLVVQFGTVGDSRQLGLLIARAGAEAETQYRIIFGPTGAVLGGLAQALYLVRLLVAALPDASFALN